MSATAFNRGTSTDASQFVTRRRGGPTSEMVHEIAALRARERPVPWQAIAKRYGYPEPYLRGLVEPPSANVDEPLEPVADPLARALETAADNAASPEAARVLREVAASLGQRP